MAILGSGSTTAVLKRGVEEANNEIANYEPQWAMIATPVEDHVGEGSFVQRSDDVPFTLANYESGDLTPVTFGNGPVQTVTGQGLGQAIRVKYRDWSTNPERATKAFQAARNMVFRQLDSLVFTLINALKSTTYSDGTGTPYIVTDGVTAHKCKGGSPSWTNHVASSFDETSFNQAVALLQTSRNWNDGKPSGAGMGPLAVVCHPNEHSAALKIAASRTIPFQNGAAVGQVDNPNASKDIRVVSSPWLTDTNDVTIIDRTYTPIHVAITVPFSLQYDFDVYSQDLIISVVGEASAFCDVPPKGLVTIVAS